MPCCCGGASQDAMPPCADHSERAWLGLPRHAIGRNGKGELLICARNGMWHGGRETPEGRDGAVLVRRQAAQQALACMHHEVRDPRALRDGAHEPAQLLVGVHVIHPCNPNPFWVNTGYPRGTPLGRFDLSHAATQLHGRAGRWSALQDSFVLPAFQRCGHCHSWQRCVPSPCSHVPACTSQDLTRSGQRGACSRGRAPRRHMQQGARTEAAHAAGGAHRGGTCSRGRAPRRHLTVTGVLAVAWRMAAQQSPTSSACSISDAPKQPAPATLQEHLLF